MSKKVLIGVGVTAAIAVTGIIAYKAVKTCKKIKESFNETLEAFRDLEFYDGPTESSEEDSVA